MTSQYIYREECVRTHFYTNWLLSLIIAFCLSATGWMIGPWSPFTRIETKIDVIHEAVTEIKIEQAVVKDRLVCIDNIGCSSPVPKIPSVQASK